MIDEEYEMKRAALFAAIAAENYARGLTPFKTGKLANIALKTKKEGDGYLVYYDANISPYLYQNPVVYQKLISIRQQLERIFQVDMAQRLDLPVGKIRGGVEE
jgi:hypothetical protein